MGHFAASKHRHAHPRRVASTASTANPIPLSPIRTGPGTVDRMSHRHCPPSHEPQSDSGPNGDTPHNDILTTHLGSQLAWSRFPIRLLLLPIRLPTPMPMATATATDTRIPSPSPSTSPSPFPSPFHFPCPGLACAASPTKLAANNQMINDHDSPPSARLSQLQLHLKLVFRLHSPGLE